jgi:2-keto-4-pentenoate hydratase
MTKEDAKMSERGPWAKALFDAVSAGKDKPVLSGDHEGVTLDFAYAVQKDYLWLRCDGGDSVSGYKGALTAAGGQKNFGIDHALTGVLLASGEVSDGATVDPVGFTQMAMETELGYEVSRTVSSPLGADDDLPIGKVRMMIEFADLGFADKAAMNVYDLVAGNSGQAMYLKGPEIDKTVNLDEVQVTLRHNGSELHVGVGTDSLGSQYDALRFLINQTVAQGYVIEPGQVLITGALGGPEPGTPGSYEAEYHGLGIVTFTVA